MGSYGGVWCLRIFVYVSMVGDGMEIMYSVRLSM